jgi:enterochelin esterase family protein
MIIVMPYGNVEGTIATQKGLLKPADPADREGTEAVQRAKNFDNDLVNNIIPYIEKNYRVISNGDNRAIGGFSRGGGETLRSGFGNMNKFSWICCYSAYLTNKEMESSYKHVYENPDRTNSQLKLLWVSVGNEDFLYKQAVDFMDFLKSKNVNYKSFITTGGHTWMNTKVFLTETAQLLFK